MSKKRLAVGIGLLAAGCLLGSACAKREPFQARVTKEGGVSVVENPLHPQYPKAVLAVSRELALSGREEGGPSLTAIGSFAVGRDGTIYLCDERRGLVRAYDGQGAPLGSFSTRPAEKDGFDLPRLAGVTAAGELAVLSGAPHRLGFFAADGTLRRTVSLADHNLFRVAVDSAGRILMQTFRMVHPNMLFFCRRYDARLKELDKYGQSLEPQSTGNNYYPYLPIMWWCLDGRDGLVYGYPQRYELRVFDADGALTRFIRRRAAPIAVSEEEKAAYRREFAKAPYVLLHFPEAHSAFRQFSVDGRGWIYVMTWDKTPAGGGAWHDVFDEKGIYTARVLLDGAPEAWLGDRMFSLDRQASGGSILIRRRIAWTLR